MPKKIAGIDEFSEDIFSPSKGERDYDSTVFFTLQNFANRSIWCKNRIEEIDDLISGGLLEQTSIFAQNGVPDNDLGANGDLYINTSNSNFYYKSSGTWSVVLVPTSILSATGVPSNTTGNEGDLYIDTNSGSFYLKGASAWDLVFDPSTFGQLDTINNVEPVSKNIDIAVGNGLEIDDTTVPGQITLSLYVEPVVSLSGGSTNEIGSTVGTVNLSWTYNKTEISQSLNQGIGALTVGQRAYTDFTSITTDTTYTLTIDDGTTQINDSTSVIFQNKSHWGTSANTSLSSAQILGLANESFDTNRDRSFTIDGNGEYIYYAYPQSYGAATFHVNGLLNTAWTLFVVSHTNASGHTENYYVYRSNTIQNGTDILVEVS